MSIKLSKYEEVKEVPRTCYSLNVLEIESLKQQCWEVGHLGKCSGHGGSNLMKESMLLLKKRAAQECSHFLALLTSIM